MRTALQSFERRGGIGMTAALSQQPPSLENSFPAADMMLLDEELDRQRCATRGCEREVSLHPPAEEAQSSRLSNSAAWDGGHWKKPQSFWEAKLCATNWLEPGNGWLRRYPCVTAATLALIAVTSYAASLRGGFVYDDVPQILENPFVLNPHLVWRAFTGSVWAFQGASFPANFYRPLHIFSHSLLYHLGGPNPGLFHLLNVLIYAATVILVYQVGRSLLRHEIAAVVGALLWCVHPLHVEAVAWISALPELGSGFFYLLAFLIFLRADEGGKGSYTRHCAASVLFFLALLFKEMAASFPLLLIAYWFFFSAPCTSSGERVFESVKSGAGWRERVIFWLPYSAALAVYLVVRRLALGYVTNTPALGKHSVVVLEATVGLLGEHARNFFWPLHLSAFRTFDLGSSLHSPWPWFSLALLGVAVWTRTRPSFLLAWWGITLIPCLDVRQLSLPLVADRYAYLPSVGLCLAIAFVVVQWLPQRLYFRRRARILLPASVLLVTLFFWTVQAVRSIAPWHDNESLASHSLRQSPDSASLHLVLAWRLFFQSHDPEGAQREYETALRLNATAFRPMSGVTYEALIGLGQVAQGKTQFEEAVNYFQKATRVSPYLSSAYDALGSAYFPRGDYAQAAEYYGEAVRVNSQDVVARFSLGTCLMRLMRYREAAEQFRAAAAVDPTYWQAVQAQTRAQQAVKVEEAAGLRGRKRRDQ
jgi:protein O-mannosyl-transferase